MDVLKENRMGYFSFCSNSGELDETSIGFSDKSSGGRKPKIYNLDQELVKYVNSLSKQELREQLLWRLIDEREHRRW